MSETGPKMHRDAAPKPERREQETPRSSSWKRKLALAGMIIAGVETQCNRLTQTPETNNGNDQELTTEQQRTVEAARNKLALVARILLEAQQQQAEDRETADEAQANWTELQTTLQNIKINEPSIAETRLSLGNYNRSEDRVPDPFKAFQAEETFLDTLAKVKIEQSDDGLYASLDGENGFDVTVTVDVDPKNQQPVLTINQNWKDDAYTQSYSYEMLNDGEDDIENKVAMYVNRALLASVEETTRQRLEKMFAETHRQGE